MSLASLTRIPSANIVSIVDPNKERAATLASRTVGATVYENLEDCVDAADVVYILTILILRGRNLLIGNSTGFRR